MNRRNGFVYIFLRADGLRKLGWTTSVSRRRSEHNLATGIVHDFEVAWEMGNRAALRVEQTAHNLLKGLSCDWSREVYDLPLARLVDAVERAMQSASRELPDGLASYFQPIVRADNLDEIVAEANAYLQDNPALLQEIDEYRKAADLRLEDNS
jgi:hypothetical protein